MLSSIYKRHLTYCLLQRRKVFRHQRRWWQIRPSSPPYQKDSHSFCSYFDHEYDLQALAYAIIWIKRRLDSESLEPFTLPNRFLIDVAILREGW